MMLPRSTSFGARVRRRMVCRAFSRRGAALMAVMVCLVVAALSILAMLRATVLEQRQLATQMRALQAEQLAEAGLARAAARLRQAADYQGEVWSVTADQLVGQDAATVTIRVETMQNRPRQRKVVAQADYPQDAARRVRKTRDSVITLPSSDQLP